MLYESAGDIYKFLIVFGVMFLSAICFDVFGLINFLCNKNKIIKIFCDFFAFLLCFIIFYLCVLKINYGQFRWYLILSMLCALVLERLTLGKVLAKTYLACYNLFRKFANSITDFAQKVKTKWTKQKDKNKQ